MAASATRSASVTGEPSPLIGDGEACVKRSRAMAPPARRLDHDVQDPVHRDILYRPCENRAGKADHAPRSEDQPRAGRTRSWTPSSVERSSHLYEVERRVRHAERPGLPDLGAPDLAHPAGSLALHTHVQDTFYVLEGRLRPLPARSQGGGAARPGRDLFRPTGTSAPRHQWRRGLGHLPRAPGYRRVRLRSARLNTRVSAVGLVEARHRLLADLLPHRGADLRSNCGSAPRRGCAPGRPPA